MAYLTDVGSIAPPLGTIPREGGCAAPADLAKRGLKVSSVLRDLLEREFPDTSGQFRLPL
jgi:hypothetical protein